MSATKYQPCTGSVICRCRICKPSSIMFAVLLVVAVASSALLVLAW